MSARPSLPDPLGKRLAISATKASLESLSNARIFSLGRPMPNRSGGALIGRVGGSEPFLIGDERGPIRMRESGRLSLGVNDDFLEDNRGSFRVTIYY